MLRDDDTNWTLLTRYLAGECSTEERAEVEHWLAADPTRAHELEELRRWWDDAALLPSSSRIDAMWRDLSLRMRGAEDVRGGRAHPLPAARRSTPVLALEPRRPARRIAWRAAAGALAASLVLAAGTTLVWRGRTSSRAVAASEAPSRDFSTTRGQRATIRLVDGTRVELGFASTLRVKPFESGRRELYLEGEALFDVVHDPARPFIVHAANAVTEDLGTTFGVRAYPSDSAVRVVVVSGRVAMRARQTTPGPSDSGAVLGPGQLGRLDTAGRLEVTSHVDTSAYVAWLSGRIAFQNARLDEVAAELERRFDVAIRIGDPRLAARRVTVDMPPRSLADVLDAIVVPLDLHHRRDRGVIVLER